MKNTLIYTLFSLGLAFCLFQSSSSGRANAAGSGNTGAPGEATTCITCHGTNASVQVDLNIEIQNADGEIVTTYLPETTYNLKVSITPTMGEPAAYGFQMVSINAPVDEDGEAINTWANASDNASIIDLSFVERTYVEHDGPSSTNEFTVEWTAPSEGAGVVTFYACGNGVNFNGSTSGDNADCQKLEFSEGIVSSTATQADGIDIQLAPNPAHDFVQLLSKLETSGSYSIQIFTLSGQLMQEQFHNLPSGEQNTRLDISQLPSGTYILRLGNPREAAHLKLVKL